MPESPTLLVYRHNGIRLARQPLGANGRVWLEVLGVSVGWEGDRLAYYLPDGRRIPEAAELDRRNVDLADRVAHLSDRVETTEKERDDAREAAASAREAAAAAREEAVRFAKRVQELEALLKPQPPQ